MKLTPKSCLKTCKYVDFKMEKIIYDSRTHYSDLIHSVATQLAVNTTIE